MSVLLGLAIGSTIGSLLLKGRYNNNLQTLLAENGYIVKRDSVCAYDKKIRVPLLLHLVPIGNILATSYKSGKIMQKSRKNSDGKIPILEKLKEQNMVEELSPLEKALIEDNKAYGKPNRAMVKWWRIRERLGMERLSEKSKARAAELVRSRSQAVNAAQATAQNTNAQQVRPATQNRPVVRPSNNRQAQPQPQRPSVIRPGQAQQQRPLPQRPSVIRPTNNQPQPRPQNPSVIRPSNGQVQPRPQNPSAIRPSTAQTPRRLTPEEIRQRQLDLVDAEIAALKAKRARLSAMAGYDQEIIDLLDQYALGLESRSRGASSQSNSSPQRR